ncbi:MULTISPECIES: PIN domain-containing protein [Roseofilum]|uniref:PIN domain-containing protein n=2 Tax=Roseofilum TaxID=1233426 RepID=A0ABT7B2C9_9CYAN|nr:MULTISPECIES: PIN domain-containing protein [Roseofilum]MDJ1168191.1 PIN domain-containing protein [Roseofilum acuticapitatum BLCC-M154]MDJ1173323.1 PIN domain-containing protein [Roseofilum capinflatum BLCC-M114]
MSHYYSNWLYEKILDIGGSDLVNYRIYMDVCCLHRPFDDQSQQRIKLETEAIDQITLRCLSGDFILISSTAIESEISQNPNPNQAEQVMQSLSIAQDNILVTDNVVGRARELVGLGLKSYDALHIACAEEGNVDIFLTTDDRLMKKAIEYEDILRVKVANPVIWLMDVET